MENPIQTSWTDKDIEKAKKFFDKYISRENIKLAWRE